MNHFSLLAHLYVLSTQTPQQPPKNSTSHPQQICLKEINEAHHDKTKKMEHKEAYTKRYKK